MTAHIVCCDNFLWINAVINGTFSYLYCCCIVIISSSTFIEKVTQDGGVGGEAVERDNNYKVTTVGKD